MWGNNELMWFLIFISHKIFEVGSYYISILLCRIYVIALLYIIYLLCILYGILTAKKLSCFLFGKCMFIQSASTWYCQYFTFIVLLILIYLLMCSCVYRLVYENFYTHVVILYNAHCLQIVMPALMMMPRHHKLRS